MTRSTSASAHGSRRRRRRSVAKAPPPPPLPQSEAVEADASAGAATQVFFWLLLAMLVAFGVWMAMTRLDVVSQAPGEVVPSTSVKTVQHLEGGIIREILVRESQEVTAGQPLAELENTASTADVGELQARESTLRLRVARLSSEAADARTMTVPDDLAEAEPGKVAEALSLFRARRTRLEQDLAGAAQDVIQRTKDIEEIQARLRNAGRSLDLLDEQIRLSAGLLKDNLTTRFNHLAFLREKAELTSRVEEDTAALDRARSALAEAEADAGEISAAYHAKVREALEETRGELQELHQRQRKFEDALGRTVVRSPVDGIVKKLHVVTIGGVLRPGEPIADIVPVEDRLVIEARLPTADVAFVRPGQRAVVRLASQEALSFGGLEARVVTVSPDALADEDGWPYYRVRVETEEDHFERDGQDYRLFPGMQVTAAVHTHRRTVLEYLLAPFLSGMPIALGER